MLAINKMIIGGTEQQFMEIVKGIDKQRFDIVVLTLYAGGDLEAEITNIPGLSYVCLQRKSKYNILNLWDVFQLLRKYKVDILQSFLTPTTFYTLIPAILNRTPIKIITERSSARTNLTRGYLTYLRIEDYFTKFADKVIPNSESGKEFLISRGINPSKIEVIYNGINLDRLSHEPDEAIRIRKSLAIGDDEKVVGIAASLFPLKDHETFLRSAKIVSDTIESVKFIILGDGPLMDRLKDLCKDLGIASKVIFTGNQTEISPYLANVDVACLCSREPEGCSNSILEAMAMGKPVVATAIGGNPELVDDGKTGTLVPVRNPKALAQAIVTLIQDPQRAREMGQQGQKVINLRFTLEAMVSNYENLYEIIYRQKTSS